MKIEDGKYYRTRDGCKAGPAVKGAASPKWTWTVLLPNFQECNSMFLDNGSYFTDGGKCAHDLAEEWVDAPSPLKLEVGKYYRTKDGQKVGPLKLSDSGERFIAEVGSDFRLWQPDGTRSSIFERIPGLEIVEEWKDAEGIKSGMALAPIVYQSMVLSGTVTAAVVAQPLACTCPSLLYGHWNDCPMARNVR